MGWVKFASGMVDDITLYGNHVGDSSFMGWSLTAAETIDGQNQVIWTHTSGSLSEWNVDGNWNAQSFTEHAPGSNGVFDVETSFQMDFNGDGSVGIAYSTVHTAGNVAFQKASGSGLYAVSVNGGASNAITNGGTQIHEGIYGGWETLAAAEIGGVNTVLWKNTSANRLHTWYLDSNWKFVSSQDWVDPNSADAIAFETNFNMDLNGDSVIGSSYSTVHTAGEVDFQKDSLTGAYAVSVNGGASNEITNGGTQIHEGIYGGWETLAAAEVNGVNTVLWKNTSANRLHTWYLDSNWNHVSSQDWVDPNSGVGLEFESNFNMDFNGNSLVGL